MDAGKGFMHLGALWSEGSVTDMGPCGAKNIRATIEHPSPFRVRLGIDGEE
jgi:hypothetical protein